MTMFTKIIAGFAVMSMLVFAPAPLAVAEENDAASASAPADNPEPAPASLPPAQDYVELTPLAQTGATPEPSTDATIPEPSLTAIPYGTLIEQAAREFDLPPSLIRAVVTTESNFDSRAVSPKGAVGLMQLMPKTARRLGAVDIMDPRTNLRTGAKYLRWLLDRFGSNLKLAVAAYNAGEGAVDKYGGQVPPYPETRAYVAKILARYQRLRSADVAASRPEAPPIVELTKTSARPRGGNAEETLQGVSHFMQAVLFSNAFR